MADSSILDASFMEVSSKLSDDEYQNEVIQYVQGILNKRFSGIRQKTTVRKYSGRINFACPICGDSVNDVNKKRGNIITRGKYSGFYKCHNCGAAMSVVKFLKKCGVRDIDPSLVSYARSVATNSKNSQNTAMHSDMLFYTSDIDELCVTRDELKNTLHLHECDGTDGTNFGMFYLHNRLQYDHSKYLYDQNNNYLYVLNLTPTGRVFGLQTRDLDEKRAKKYGKYKTYSIRTIWETLIGRVIDDDMIGFYEEYETLSMFFNVLVVDYSKPVFVTEGPMDAIILGNSVALCGGSKKVDFGMDLYYIYDSDRDGVKYAINALNEGNYVFMWTKYIKDNNLPYRKKWDINDLFLYYSEKRTNIPNILPYFTNDKCDILLL